MRKIAKKSENAIVLHNERAVFDKIYKDIQFRIQRKLLNFSSQSVIIYYV